MNMDRQLEKLNKALELVQTEDAVTRDELATIVADIFDILEKVTKEHKKNSESFENGICQDISEFKKKVEQIRKELDRKIEGRGIEVRDIRDHLADEISRLETIISEIRLIEGQPGRDGVDGKDGSPDTPEQVVDKVNVAQKKIRKSQIEGLEDIERIAKYNSGSAMPITTTLVNGKRAKNLNFPNATVNVNGDTASVTVTAVGTATWGSVTGTLSDQTDLQTALDAKIDKNISITGATKTKITYDADGLITAGADATTADIADSTNKRYVTDAQLVVIGNTSGTNTGDQNLSSYVVGPASSTDNALVRFDGTTGKLIQNSSTNTLSDTGQHLGPNGSGSAPTYGFTNDPDVGWFLESTALLSLTVAGSRVANFSSTLFGMSDTYGLSWSSGSDPGSGRDTGLKRSSAGILAVTNGSTGAGSLVPLVTDGGSLGTSSLNWSDLFLDLGAVINFDNGDVTLTHSLNTLTLAGGDFALGANNLTMTGSIGATGARVTKIWATDGEFTNMPTVGGTAILTSLTGPQFTTIELGHASDTTLSRVSAGVVAIEGVNILTTAGGTLTGNITLGENTSIDLDPAGSADGKYSGICITGTAGTTLAFGDLVYLSSTDSRWELADADAASTSDRLLGMCVLAAAADGNDTKILLQGNIRADAAFPALTIGSPVYVGETAGDIQVAIPTGADNVIRRVGYALTADELYFNPSMDSQTTVA